MLGLGTLAARTRPARAAEAEGGASAARPVTLFLAGDVMTGRGIDQVLSNPGDPRLFEPYVTSAGQYVSLAEEASGPIPRPADFAYVWGDALDALAAHRPDLRVINLETAVTANDEPATKGINYRMHPENAPVLEAAGIDCCVLANNHVLDWGTAGLGETLETLAAAGIAATGAGRDCTAAEAPAVLPVRSGSRVLVFAYGVPTSGIPESWAATRRRPGVNFLPDLSAVTLRRVADGIAAARRPGDIVLASIHWGPNWGYEVPEAQVSFARGLVEEAGVDIVHGHSSHHPKAIEVYRDRPILYGCGDFLNDYEGIGGHEAYRPDLTLMYLPRVRATAGLAGMTMVPFRIRRFRLERASEPDAAWLRDRLDNESRRFGTRVELATDGTLRVAWG